MSNPIVYLIINQYVDTYDYNVGGISYIENIEEFKCNVTNKDLFRFHLLAFLNLKTKRSLLFFYARAREKTILKVAKSIFTDFYPKKKF